MTLEFVPFQPWHAYRFELQPMQKHLRALTYDPSYGQIIQEPDLSFTAMIERHILGMAGVKRIAESSKGSAWALVGIDPIHPLAWCDITRKTVEILNAAHAAGIERIEATVRCDFRQGHKWAVMLGFIQEAERMRRWGRDGEDHALYARVAGPDLIARQGVDHERH